jgi:hypothetical protein
MKHPNVPTYREWKKYEQVVRACRDEVLEHGKKELGDIYGSYYYSALEAHKILVSQHLAKLGGSREDDAFKYLSYSVLWGSTPVYEDSPYLDFPGDASVATFLEERMNEVDELVRIREQSKNRT